MPSAWVSLPGPEHSSRARPGRAALASPRAPPVGSSARIRTAAAVALGLGDGVEQAVDPVGEVDVGASRRPEEQRRPLGQPDVGVAGRVVALVALGLDDHPADAVDAQARSRSGRGRPRAPSGRRTPRSSAAQPAPRALVAQPVAARAPRAARRAAPTPCRRPTASTPATTARAAPRSTRRRAARSARRAPPVSSDSDWPRSSAVAHQPADHAVRLAERHPAAHQQVGDVGGGEQLVARRPRRAARGRSSMPGEHPARPPRGRARACRRRRTAPPCPPAGPWRRRAAARAGRRAASSGEPTTRGAFARSSSAASGFFFCGMRRRAGGEVVGELAEAELLARPDHDLGAQPREVRRADRPPRQVVEHEVAVGDGVDRVRRDARRSRARAAIASRSRSQLSPASAPEPSGISAARRGARREPPRVAREHPEVGEQVVAEVDRLGALQVRVAGHRPVGVALGERRAARSISAASSSTARARALAHEERQVGGDLVVARARRCGACRRAGRRARSAGARPPCGCPRRRRANVELAALELVRDRGRGRGSSSSQLVVGDAPRRAASAAACAREPLDVVRPQPPVEADRGVDARRTAGPGGVEKRDIGASIMTQMDLEDRGAARAGRWRRACASSPATPDVEAVARDSEKHAAALLAPEDAALRVPPLDLDPVGEPEPARPRLPRRDWSRSRVVLRRTRVARPAAPRGARRSAPARGSCAGDARRPRRCRRRGRHDRVVAGPASCEERRAQQRRARGRGRPPRSAASISANRNSAR